MTTDHSGHDYISVETPVEPEPSQTITDSQVVNVGPQEPQQPPVVSTPTSPPIQASTGAWKSLLTTLGAFLTMIPAGLWGLFQSNQDITKWAIIMMGFVAAVFILRQIVLDIVRIWVRADPAKFNVR